MSHEYLKCFHKTHKIQLIRTEDEENCRYLDLKEEKKDLVTVNFYTLQMLVLIIGLNILNII